MARAAAPAAGWFASASRMSAPKRHMVIPISTSATAAIAYPLKVLAGRSRLVFIPFNSTDMTNHSFDIIMISYLYRAGAASSVVADRLDECVAIGLELPCADPLDLAQRGQGLGPQRGHLAQGGVVEDHVGRQARGTGEVAPHFAQAFEQRVAHRVRLSAPPPARARRRRRDDDLEPRVALEQ